MCVCVWGGRSVGKWLDKGALAQKRLGTTGLVDVIMLIKLQYFCLIFLDTVMCMIAMNVIFNKVGLDHL